MKIKTQSTEEYQAYLLEKKRQEAEIKRVKRTPEYKAIRKASVALVKAVEAAKSIKAEVFVGLYFADSIGREELGCMFEPCFDALSDSFKDVMRGTGAVEEGDSERLDC
jgi:hypothetical protein